MGGVLFKGPTERRVSRAAGCASPSLGEGGAPAAELTLPDRPRGAQSDVHAAEAWRGQCSCQCPLISCQCSVTSRLCPMTSIPVSAVDASPTGKENYSGGDSSSLASPTRKENYFGGESSPLLGKRERIAAGKRKLFLDPEEQPGAVTTSMAVNFLESSAESINAISDQSVLPFEVILDSGAAEHVLDQSDAPGYPLEVSAGSARGATFSAANGAEIANQGQMVLNLSSREGNPLRSTFQVCAVSRPLWSVGRICDNGCTVTFDAKGAIVKSKEGKEACTLERRNGLYASTLGLRKPGAETIPMVKPPGFIRQGR